MCMFNPVKAYQHAVSLAIPRAAGTSGEKMAKSYCAHTLKTFGIDVHDQPFNFSTLPEMITRVLPFMFGLLLWVIAMLFESLSLNMFLILIGTSIAGTVCIFFWFPLKKLHTGTGRMTSANLTGDIPAQNQAKHHLVFMAHYDSKSQLLPIAIRSVCYIGLLICYSAAISSYVFSYWHNDFPHRLLVQICGSGALLFGTLLLINVTRNRSPGAADNACGAAIVIELARIFAKEPLSNVCLSFLLTGAEEYCLAGAFNHVKQQGVSVPERKFINIDGVGQQVPIRIIGREKRHVSADGQSLVSGLTAAARTISVTLVKMSALIGIGFDHGAMVCHGYEAITLACGNLGTLLRIHSPRDRIELIEPAALDGIGRLCEMYARNLDRK